MDEFVIDDLERRRFEHSQNCSQFQTGVKRAVQSVAELARAETREFEPL